MQKAYNVRVANVAKARVIFDKKKETFVVIAAFNVTECDHKNRYKFPVRNKCDFVSGEFVYETFEADMARVIAQAKQALCTDMIEFVA